MCGIVGYIGTKKAVPVLIKGLLSLEYRGYDSSGICILENTTLEVVKDKGRVKNLEENSVLNTLNGNIGIAHTRWATHGIPSKENAHPHLDNTKTFAVVHNGIIENYTDLRKFLESKGYTLISQTDTEVIPNLISYYYSLHNDVLKAVSLAIKDLKGSYAIEVISPLLQDKIIVARKDSPLVIGIGNKENFIASDIPAILNYTNKFYFLDDFELSVISNDSIEFYDINLNKIEKDIKDIEWDCASSEKNGFEDYMLKEIYEQSTSIMETIGSRLKPNEKCYFDDLDIDLKDINRIYIIACGTAMHAGIAAKYTFEHFCKIPVEVDMASEFRYRNPLIDKHTLCIFISQSGETADTIAALKLAKSLGSKTLAVVNVIGSSITRVADYTIYTHAGPEIAVASTKAYTAQVVLLNILAVYFAEILGYSSDELEDFKMEILELPDKVKIILENSSKIQDFAKEVYTRKDMFFIGRNTDYATSMEASLKLKEISYIHSEAYAAGELKHGPIALIENGVTVIGIATNPNLVEKTVSNLEEVITRGANVMIVTNQDLPNINSKLNIEVPKCNPMLSPILSVIPLQLFSYYIAKNKGLDVDKPRNLAKSVTVE